MSSDRVSATGHVAAPAHKIFVIVANPARHTEIDGSGMLQATADPTPLTKVGQVFGMDMDRRPLGDIPNMAAYRIRNTVTRLIPDRLLEWTVSREGDRPVGHVWGWEIEPISESDCLVANYCDWTNVSDEVRRRIVERRGGRPWPIVPVEMLERSVENLARIATTT
jgi:hypothetical protein